MGCVLKYWQGHTIDAFTTNLRICSITCVELTCIALGMERSWNIGLRELEVQNDSLCAVTLFSRATLTDHQHATMVAQYRRPWERNLKVKLKHIF
ncbi:hypothetical protein LINPERHAP1_LOCUS219 [Linum perenne]